LERRCRAGGNRCADGARDRPLPALKIDA
jgi:hypothetical protein